MSTSQDVYVQIPGFGLQGLVKGCLNPGIDDPCSDRSCMRELAYRHVESYFPGAGYLEASACLSWDGVGRFRLRWNSSRSSMICPGCLKDRLLQEVPRFGHVPHKFGGSQSGWVLLLTCSFESCKKGYHEKTHTHFPLPVETSSFGCYFFDVPFGKGKQK